MKKILKSMLAVAALTGYAAATDSENFGGLGISVWTGKSGVKIAGVLPNSPAQDIGLQNGDLILSANGTDLSSVQPDLQIGYLRGEAGSSITIVVDRGGEKISLSTKRVDLSVQNLEAADIAAWYGKNNGLTEDEISYLASHRLGENYELLGVTQYGMPIARSAENLNASALQQISVKKAVETVAPPSLQQPETSTPEYFLNKAQNAPLVNVKGAYVKKQGSAPVYRKIR
jgi:hypothetical protein